MAKRLSVLLTTEGTYPYHAGGVSTWCDHLIRGLPAVEFIVLPIMMHPYISVKYELPVNVSKVITVPLWGIEEPAEYILDIPFSHVYVAKHHTVDGVIAGWFLPLFREFVRLMYAQPTDARRGGEILYELYLYFRAFDYNTTFKSQLVWEAFREEVLKQAVGRSPSRVPSLFELTEGLRWLYRFLIPLNADPPKVDVTHSTAAAFCGIPCIIAKLRDGTPFVLTEHGVYVREQYLSVSRSKTSLSTKDLLLNLIVTVSRINYEFADQISPVCHYNKRWELAHGASESKIKVIHNGIDPAVFRPAEGGVSGGNVVISVARIDPLKDIETLIRAAGHVTQADPRVRFVAYGGVADADYYRRCLELRTSLGLDQAVSFFGHSGSPWEAYHQGDVVVLTSISEAFPYSVIEAMACGRAIVASDVGGVREALEGCGLLVKPRDPEGFAESILTLLQDPDTRFQMGQDARDRVLNSFTLERSVARYGDSYRELGG